MSELNDNETTQSINPFVGITIKEKIKLLYTNNETKALSNEEIKSLLLSIKDNASPKRTSLLDKAIVSLTTGSIYPEYFENLNPKSSKAKSNLLKLAEAYRKTLSGTRSNGVTQNTSSDTDNETQSIIKLTKDNTVLIASTDKVKDKFLSMGYEPDEITEISRIKKGTEFARAFGIHLKSIPYGSIQVIDGKSREGETALLRQLIFSEPLREVIAEAWDKRHISVVLITHTRIYNLKDELDFADMLSSAVHMTYNGRIKQDMGRATGFSEHLRLELTTRRRDIEEAFEDLISMYSRLPGFVLKDNFSDKFCTRLVEEYKFEYVSGYSISEFRAVLDGLVQEFKGSTGHVHNTCKNANCNNDVIGKGNMCPSCTKKFNKMLEAGEIAF